MENRAHALVAGIFVLLLGLAAGFALWWFTDQRDELTTYHLVSTGSVTGLNPQAQVRFRGISAGKVNNIRIDPDDPRNIIVSIEVRSDLPITHGTRATLGYQGVTGLAFVQLDDRGDDPRPLISDGRRPARLALEAGLFEQLSDAALDAVSRFRRVSDDVGSFFDETNVARFRNTLQTLESAATGLDKTLSEAPEVMADLRRMLSEENARHLASALEGLDRLSNRAVPLTEEAQIVLGRLDELLGTLGALARATGDSFLDTSLPQLNNLLAELTDTSARLGRLIDEVDAAPQMLITGRSERKPGPGEDGFRP